LIEKQEKMFNLNACRKKKYMKFKEWSAPSKISVNPRYIEHLNQHFLWLSEYMQINSRVNRGLA